MTNQEAIDELQYAIDLIKQDGKDWLDERDIPILEAAISALQEQEAKRSTGSSLTQRELDTISRQAVLELTMQYCPDDDGSCSKAGSDIRELLDDIENLPSAQPGLPDLPEWAKKVEYHDPFGNPIYVYVRVNDKTVTIKADDLQKALDYVTEHSEEVTIEGRRKAMVEGLFDAPDAEGD